MVQSDPLLASIPLPLGSTGIDQVMHPLDLMNGGLFGKGMFRSEGQTDAPRIEGSILDLSGLPVLAGRTTPLDAWEVDSGTSSLTMCFAGTPRYSDDCHTLAAGPGDVLILPRNGGRMSTGYLSSLNFPVVHGRLHRTLQAMQAVDVSMDLEVPYLFAADGGGAGGSASLFAFFAFVDQVHSEDRHLSVALGIDEQIHRLLALMLSRASPGFEKLEHHWCAPACLRPSVLDDLVDYIRASIHRPLTLTDLEERSHYSARHLQNLFRARFDCTPMQFVRRQRLAAAMERLQAAGPQDSVTRIARDCGYRQLAHFSSDFQRRFGIAASTVLRQARTGGGRTVTGL